MKFRKKPVVIDATQFREADKDTHAHVNFSRPGAGDNSVDLIDGKHWVQTSHGPAIVSDGDWVITGVNGEHYPCADDFFRATYEPAEGHQEIEAWARGKFNEGELS